MKKLLGILVSVFLFAGMFFAVLPAFSFSPFASADDTARAYYVSSESGNDENDGSLENPFRSLAMISQTYLNPNDTVYLKRGEVFAGSVMLHGMGTSEAPITLTAYGHGDRPYIKGTRDDESSAIKIGAGSQGFRIIGIEMGGTKYGITIMANDSIANDYYYIEDCYIHDCFDTRSGYAWATWFYWGKGIAVLGPNGDYYNDPNEPGEHREPKIANVSRLTVTNCIFLNNDSDFIPAGVFLTDVLFYGCTLMRSHYNSLYQTMGTNFDIINCVWRDAGTAHFEAGVTCVLAGGLTGGPDTNTVFGNEFGFTRDSGGADGCAYDFEFSTDGITFSDNFVHNSFGEAVLMMKEAVCHDIKIADNIFYRNLVGTDMHNSEVGLYGKGTGVVVGNIYEYRKGREFVNYVRPRGIVTIFKEMEGNKSGFLVADNVQKNLSALMLTPPIFAFNAGGEAMAEGGATASYLTLLGPVGAHLYYTTDGSVPTKDSTRYLGEAIVVHKTTVINVKAFRDGYMESYTETIILSPDGVVALPELPEMQARGGIFPLRYLAIGLAVFVVFGTLAVVLMIRLFRKKKGTVA